MKNKKIWHYPLLALGTLFIILFFAPNKGLDCHTDVRKWIFLIVSYTGVLFFVIKTFITIIYETKKQRKQETKKQETKKEEGKQGKGIHVIPIAAYAYMLFSIVFISFFIYDIYKYDFYFFINLLKFIDISNTNDISISFLHSTIYLVIIAFVLNFSKSFFTINALEYGIVRSNPITQEKIEGKNMKLIIEVIIRVIAIICFILAEQQLFNFYHEDYGYSKLLCQIERFAQYTIILYVSLLIWVLYFNKIIYDKVSLKDDKWALQFMFGLLLGFFLLYFGIGHFEIGSWRLGNDWNIFWGCILYLLPSLTMCYFLIYIEIDEFKNFAKRYLNMTE